MFTEFEIKNLGRLKYFLGIRVLQSIKKNLYILAEVYSIFTLGMGMVDCKLADTPIQFKHGFQIVEDADSSGEERYQRLGRK